MSCSGRKEQLIQYKYEANLGSLAIRITRRIRLGDHHGSRSSLTFARVDLRSIGVMLPKLVGQPYSELFEHAALTRRATLLVRSNLRRRDPPRHFASVLEILSLLRTGSPMALDLKFRHRKPISTCSSLSRREIENSPGF